ncbi:MAG: murein transglycosylase A [Rhodospirillaceae bacterium]|nr:murein transglycosylase A [Rhodospirillaceae bacterium]
MFAVLLLAACAGGKPSSEPVEPVQPAPAPAPTADAGDALYLTPATFEQLPGWSEDPMSAALPALLRSCQKLVESPPETPVGPNGFAGTVADWIPLCNTAWGLTPRDDIDMRAFMSRWFAPFLVSGADGADGLFTGYYEPELYGSLTPSPQYPVALYRAPDDMVTVPLGPFRTDLEGENIVGRVDGTRFVPYYSHQEIDQGVLAGRGLELLYVDDPIAAFFLHIQGSGRVFLDDGTEMRVGYAGKNGRPYVPIGRVLADRGEIPLDQVSLQSIRAWLEANPDRAREVMYQNPSFIFFQRIDGEGPIGAQGVVLMPSRSIAVDTRLLPLGVPLYVDTVWPAGVDQGLPMRRLMIAQDTGGAIRGPVRGDIYWGSGEIAGEFAGAMKSQGRYYLLLPLTVAERRAQSS